MPAKAATISLQNGKVFFIVILLTMETLMKAYRGTFKKRNGQMREMLFAKIEDLPDKFLDDVVKGTGSERSYPVGTELVWDLEADNFRLFNHATAEQPLKEVPISEDHFM